MLRDVFWAHESEHPDADAKPKDGRRSWTPPRSAILAGGCIAGRPIRWRFCVRGTLDRHLLPAILSIAPPSARARRIFRRSGSRGARRIPAVPPLRSEGSARSGGIAAYPAGLQAHGRRLGCSRADGERGPPARRKPFSAATNISPHHGHQPFGLRPIHPLAPFKNKFTGG